MDPDVREEDPVQWITGITEAAHRRQAGSPCGPGPAETAHIDLGASWRECGFTEVRVHWSAYWGVY